MTPATIISIIVSVAGQVLAQATAPAVGRFPHLEVDVQARQVRVECEALRVEAPLEFFCCVKGTNEHEAVLRSQVTPSHLHAALLMLGLEPGQPVHYSEAAKKWLPPHGPPLRITIEFEQDGKVISLPAYRLMRDIRSKKEMPPLTWIFAGSRVMDDGNYAADVTGYLVSIVNFDLTVIDVPALVSNANETLEWETNLDLMPPAGKKVSMIIEPAGSEGRQPTTAPSAVKLDEEKLDRLRQRWDQIVRPHAGALREAAQTQYEVIAELRREQQRLIDEADRIQRLIDQLQREYDDMTTPRPPPSEPKP
jgi:hypothetical protein